MLFTGAMAALLQRVLARHAAEGNIFSHNRERGKSSIPPVVPLLPRWVPPHLVGYPSFSFFPHQCLCVAVTSNLMDNSIVSTASVITSAPHTSDRNKSVS
jgi:hypothetical protein